jgi:hypothetical protein
LKTSDELEIYEIDQASKERMEEICDLRQPVIFEGDEYGGKIINSTNRNFIVDNYPIFEVKIRENINNKSSVTTDTNNQPDICVPLPLRMTLKLFDEDTKGLYFSENNHDFLHQHNYLSMDNDDHIFLHSDCMYYNVSI